MCNKVRHSSYGNAKVALKKYNIATLEVYRCGKCKGFHLGNTRRNHYKIQKRIDQLLNLIK